VSEVGWVSSRCCSRTACKHPPVYTLTYVYRDSTAVLGPLAAYVEPHCYDLCEKHAGRLTAPRGWDVVRLPMDPAQERADDLEALANAVMETHPQRRLSKDLSKDLSRDLSRDLSKDGSRDVSRDGSNNVKDRGQDVNQEPVGQGVEVGRRGHLRVLRSGPPQDG
jgi:hypothetical protein